MAKLRKKAPALVKPDYSSLLNKVSELLEGARRASARSVNTVMTFTYFHIGKQIFESEQRGAKRSDYGQELIMRLSVDLSKKYGRGFSKRNLHSMLKFYKFWSISQTIPGKASISDESRKSQRNRIVHKLSSGMSL